MKVRTLNILGILLFLLVPVAVHAVSSPRVVVYAAYGCSLCPDDPVREATLEYFSELTRALKEIDVTDIQLRLIDIDSEAHRGMDELYQKLNVPESLRGSLVVCIDEKFLFVHVPVKIIADFLANHANDYLKITVFRDPLRDTYKVMSEDGSIIECEMKTSITDCLRTPGHLLQSLPLWSTLSLIVISGFLDGVNPCAFAVLLFFVTLLFARGISGGNRPNQIKHKVLLYGLTYILAVYLGYLFIGLSLREVIRFVPFPHLLSKIGSLVVIAAGIMKVMDCLWPSRLLNLSLSTSQWERIGKWMSKVTLPATFVTGTLVAFFEFPCTGGIYLAVLGVLAARTTFLEGLVYLLLYNTAFILPLLALLIVACKKEIVEFSLRKWQQREEKKMKLIEGAIYTGLGALLLFSVLV